MRKHKGASLAKVMPPCLTSRLRVKLTRSRRECCVVSSLKVIESFFLSSSVCFFIRNKFYSLRFKRFYLSAPSNSQCFCSFLQLSISIISFYYNCHPKRMLNETKTRHLIRHANGENKKFIPTRAAWCGNFKCIIVCIGIYM